jgi:hypothetical protein
LLATDITSPGQALDLAISLDLAIAHDLSQQQHKFRHPLMQKTEADCSLKNFINIPHIRISRDKTTFSYSLHLGLIFV